MVRDVIEGIVERGTPSAANQAFACIRAFFSWAVEQDYCLSTPCATLKMPAKEVARQRVLSDPEIAAIGLLAIVILEPLVPL
jgi:site-specific recombinase XerD